MRKISLETQLEKDRMGISDVMIKTLDETLKSVNRVLKKDPSNIDFDGFQDEIWEFLVKMYGFHDAFSLIDENQVRNVKRYAQEKIIPLMKKFLSKKNFSLFEKTVNELE